MFRLRLRDRVAGACGGDRPGGGGDVPDAEARRPAGDHRQKRGAGRAPGDAAVGEVISPRGTGEAAAPRLPPGLQPLHFLLGRCGAGRTVHRVDGGEVELRLFSCRMQPGNGICRLQSYSARPVGRM